MNTKLIVFALLGLTQGITLKNLAVTKLNDDEGPEQMPGPPEAIDIVNDIFDQFDENGDDILGWEEIKTAMEKMFDECDEHNKEMGMEPMDEGDKREIMDWVRAEFMASDRDKSGNVDREELEDYIKEQMAEMGPPPPPALSQIMKRKFPKM